MKFNKKEIASTVSVGMVRVIRCHRRNMKNNIIWTAPTTVDKFCPHDEACSKASGLTPPR